jgi:hypothetical protein
MEPWYIYPNGVGTVESCRCLLEHVGERVDSARWEKIGFFEQHQEESGPVELIEEDEPVGAKMSRTQNGSDLV